MKKKGLPHLIVRVFFVMMICAITLFPLSNSAYAYPVKEGSTCVGLHVGPNFLSQWKYSSGEMTCPEGVVTPTGPTYEVNTCKIIPMTGPTRNGTISPRNLYYVCAQN